MTLVSGMGERHEPPFSTELGRAIERARSVWRPRLYTRVRGGGIGLARRLSRARETTARTTAIPGTSTRSGSKAATESWLLRAAERPLAGRYRRDLADRDGGARVLDGAGPEGSRRDAGRDIAHAIVEAFGGPRHRVDAAWFPQPSAEMSKFTLLTVQATLPGVQAHALPSQSRVSTPASNEACLCGYAGSFEHD